MEAVPDPVQRSAKVYRALLNLYPTNHRREFGGWMAQVFRDVCLSAYRADGTRGITRVWLKTIPDLTVSALQEHDYEIRRWLMNHKSSAGGLEPRRSMALLIGAVLIALGLLASVAIRESGGSAVAASMVAVAMNLAGALVLEFMTDRSGVLIGAMLLMLAGHLLPLLWVPDANTWLRENPVIGGVIVLIAYAYRTRFHSNWPVYAVAIIIAAAQIVVSFI